MAGDIFEAETNCNSAHNMGQIASDGVNNLSYLSRRSAITTPMEQNPVDKVEYNSSKTYMMFVMGKDAVDMFHPLIMKSLSIIFIKY